MTCSNGSSSRRRSAGSTLLLVPRQPPDQELAVGGGEGVGEHQRPLLGEVQRPLVAGPPVEQREEAAGQLVAGVVVLERGLGDVVEVEDLGAERPAPVARGRTRRCRGRGPA